MEKVFPMGPGGLPQTPPECLPCDAKTECLRSALAGDQGLAVHEERSERAYQTGAVGFLERWAQQKDFQRRENACVLVQLGETPAARRGLKGRGRTGSYPETVDE